MTSMYLGKLEMTMIILVILLISGTLYNLQMNSERRLSLGCTW